MYAVEIIDTAARDLAGLDKSAARRISLRLNWLGENFEHVRHIRLSGEFSSFYKFRIGDYRILYQILTDEKIILVHAVRHHREAYRGFE